MDNDAAFNSQEVAFDQMEEDFKEVLKEMEEDIKKNYQNEMKAIIENNFTYHPPTTEEIVKVYEDIRSNFKNLAKFLVETLPICAEVEKALSRLEEAMFWSNAAMARNKV